MLLDDNDPRTVALVAAEREFWSGARTATRAAARSGAGPDALRTMADVIESRAGYSPWARGLIYAYRQLATERSNT